MPELPEVEVVRSGLEPAVADAVVESVAVFDERSLRRHPGPAEDFADRLVGRRMLRPRRRGKFLWIPLGPIRFAQENPTASTTPGAGGAADGRDDPGIGEALVVHLGMSGQVLLRGRDAEDRHTRIRIDIAHPEAGELRLNFADQRIFGSMAIDELLPTGVPGEFVPGRVSHIARDPLDPHFSDSAFIAALARRKSGIKRALLDQTLISGIGNIYADEALWAARIHFDQPADTLSRARAKTLLAEVRLVLERALAEGGTSFDALYVNVNGASGYFAHSLNVYGQHGKPCPRCGRPLHRAQFMNRSSHFCPHCQRIRPARGSR